MFGEACIASVDTTSSTYVFKLSINVETSKENNFFFVRLVQIIESLIDNFYSRENKNKSIKRVVHCNHCLKTSSKIVHKFVHQELVDVFTKGVPDVKCEEENIQIKISGKKISKKNKNKNKIIFIFPF